MRQSITQRRLMQEIKHLVENQSEEYKARPMDNDMHTWHFTLRGPPDSEFSEGFYHGRIIFPYDYPHSPPDISFFNKSGRFEVNQKICLNITGFHSELWNSSWTVRSMLEGLISMFTEKEKVQSVGSMNSSSEQRQRHALESCNYECDKCGIMTNILKKRQKTQTTDSKLDDKLKQSKDQIQNQSSQDGQKLPLQQELQQISQNLSQISNQLALQKLLLSVQQQTQAQENHKQSDQLSKDQNLNSNENKQDSFQWVLTNIQESMNVMLSLRQARPVEQINKPDIISINESNTQLPKTQESTQQQQNQLQQEDKQINDSGQTLENPSNSSSTNVDGNEQVSGQQQQLLQEDHVHETNQSFLKRVDKKELFLFLSFIAIIIYLTFSFQINF